MSLMTRRCVAANRAVKPPTQATTSIAVGDALKSGNVRATRYTPAATIVAAWIKAETGVGPSIASGNHTCSGNWADFPTAPQKIKSATIATNVAWPSNLDIRGTISAKTTEPVVVQIIRIPVINPKSPIRVVINALFAASAAASRKNQ